MAGTLQHLHRDLGGQRWSRAPGRILEKRDSIWLPEFSVFQKNLRLTVRLTKNACTSTCPSKLALHRVKNRTSLHVKYAKKRNIAQTGIDSSIEDLPPRNRRLIQVLKRNFDQIYDTAYICQSKRMPLREEAVLKFTKNEWTINLAIYLTVQTLMVPYLLLHYEKRVHWRRFWSCWQWKNS